MQSPKKINLGKGKIGGEIKEEENIQILIFK